MRDIMFRGKVRATGDWVVGSLLNKGFEYMPNEVRIARENCGVPLFVKEDTIGQFTGICDVRGRRIFEGDYIQISCYPFACDDRCNYYGEVFWYKERLAFCVEIHKHSDSNILGLCENFVEDFCVYTGEEIEIIGNIHDGLTKDMGV